MSHSGIKPKDRRRTEEPEEESSRTPGVNACDLFFRVLGVLDEAVLTAVLVLRCVELMASYGEHANMQSCMQDRNDTDMHDGMS